MGTEPKSSRVEINFDDEENSEMRDLDQEETRSNCEHEKSNITLSP